MVGHHRHHNGSQEAAHDEQRTDQRVTVGGTTAPTALKTPHASPSAKLIG